MKTVYIELTDKQKEKLFPLFDEVGNAYERGKPVLLLSQIHIVGRDAVASCRIVDHEKSVKIQAIFNEKLVGKMTTYKHGETALNKARGK